MRSGRIRSEFSQFDHADRGQREGQHDAPVGGGERRGLQHALQEWHVHRRHLQKQAAHHRCPEPAVREEIVECADGVGSGVEGVEQLSEDQCGECDGACFHDGA